MLRNKILLPSATIPSPPKVKIESMDDYDKLNESRINNEKTQDDKVNKVETLGKLDTTSRERVPEVKPQPSISIGRGVSLERAPRGRGRGKRGANVPLDF